MIRNKHSRPMISPCRTLLVNGRKTLSSQPWESGNIYFMHTILKTACVSLIMPYGNLLPVMYNSPAWLVLVSGFLGRRGRMWPNVIVISLFTWLYSETTSCFNPLMPHKALLHVTGYSSLTWCEILVVKFFYDFLTILICHISTSTPMQ